jgi:hypothetical protein
MVIGSVLDWIPVGGRKLHGGAGLMTEKARYGKSLRK